MQIIGEFRDRYNNKCTVEFITADEPGRIVRLDGSEGIWLDGRDPVIIDCQNDDLFEPVIRSTCTVRLVTNGWAGYLFYGNNARSTRCQVRRGNTVLFDGYVSPVTYEQGWAKTNEAFQVECVDRLSTLDQYNYRNTKAGNYESRKAASSQVSFHDVLTEIFGSLSGAVWFDKSRAVSPGREASVFDDLGIGESVIYGEDFDSIMKEIDILTHILNYLTLSIVEQGGDFWIYDRAGVKKGTRNSWIDLKTGAALTKTPVLKTISGGDHLDNNTTVSLSEAFNQIQVNCEVENQDTVITSPFDTDTLYSEFKYKQPYMREIISQGEGESAHNAFHDAIDGISSTYDGLTLTDWYIQVMDSKNWVMNPQAPTQYEYNAAGEAINQYKFLDRLLEAPGRAVIFRAGKIEKKGTSATDNSLTAKIDMSNYMYISVNGNRGDTQATGRPNSNDLAQYNPIAEYTANNSQGVYSPSDDAITNYIVFTGKIILQPQWAVQQGKARENGQTVTGQESYSVPFSLGFNLLDNWEYTIPSEDNDDGRLYRRYWYRISDPSDSQDIKSLTKYTEYNGKGLMMPAKDMSTEYNKKDKHEDVFRYNYNADHNQNDVICKIPILVCELIIGNKRLVELDAMNQNKRSEFRWVDKDADFTDPYTNQVVKYFTLGFDVKIEDYIIGTEFSLQNTLSWTQNIDAEGTAAPIHKDDALSGNLTFRIVSLIETGWEDVTRIHPSFWRHTDWTTAERPLLPFVQNIILKDFEAKLYSDGGGNEVWEEKDLIYVSDEQEDYVNKKDDIDFKIITQLDSQTLKDKGIKSGVFMNACVNLVSGKPLEKIYNAVTAETARPEEIYVDQMYREYRRPKIMLKTGIKDTDSVDFRNLYLPKSISSNFFVQSISRDVRSSKATLVLRQV
jgi:hypothetical protein